MSTRIYNAYKFDGTIDALMGLLQETRKLYVECMGRALYGLRREEVRYPRFLDKVQEEMRCGFRSPLNIAAACSVCFHEGAIYVVFHGVDFGLAEYLNVKKLGMGGALPLLAREVDAKLVDDRRFSDFHYQDQSDPPEDIPEDAFSERGRIWDAIMGDERCFNRIALQFDFMSAEQVADLLRVLYPEFKRSEQVNAIMAKFQLPF